MAKVKNVEAIRRNIKTRIKEFKSDSKELERSARIIRNEIVKDSRSGEGYDGKPFPVISQKTIDRRISLSKKNRTHKDYVPFYSNATFTGDTIRKIVAKVKGQKIEIGGQGKHKKMIGVRGRPLKGSNADIADIITGLTKKGWKILGVSNRSKEKIRKQFLQFLRRRRK